MKSVRRCSSPAVVRSAANQLRNPEDFNKVLIGCSIGFGAQYSVHHGLFAHYRSACAKIAKRSSSRVVRLAHNDIRNMQELSEENYFASFFTISRPVPT